MKHILYMAWRYLRFHWAKTLILLLSISLIIYIPVGLRAFVDEGRRQLIARAVRTPLLIGAKGSPLELTLNALYFGAELPDLMKHGEAARVAEGGLARPIPLYVRFRAQDDPIVGTSLDYFDFRGLQVAAGRLAHVRDEPLRGGGDPDLADGLRQADRAGFSMPRRRARPTRRKSRPGGGRLSKPPSRPTRVLSPFTPALPLLVRLSVYLFAVEPRRARRVRSLFSRIR